MKKLIINDLYGMAYDSAIENIVNIINKGVGKNLLTRRDFEKAEDIARRLNVMFDENGEIT